MSDFDGKWILSRADGEAIDGDNISWYLGGDGAEPDWDQVECWDYDEPTEFVAVKVAVVERRAVTFGPAPADDDEPDPADHEPIDVLGMFARHLGLDPVTGKPVRSTDGGQ